jgi:hypothetical protein
LKRGSAVLGIGGVSFSATQVIYRAHYDISPYWLNIAAVARVLKISARTLLRNEWLPNFRLAVTNRGRPIADTPPYILTGEIQHFPTVRKVLCWVASSIEGANRGSRFAPRLRTTTTLNQTL